MDGRMYLGPEQTTRLSHEEEEVEEKDSLEVEEDTTEGVRIQ